MRAIVAEVADWCWVETLERAELRVFAMAQAESGLTSLADRIAQQVKADPAWRESVMEVLQSGRAVIHPEPADRSGPRPLGPEHPELLRSMGALSYMMVRIDAPGGVLGVMTFVSTRPERLFDAADLALAMDLAGRHRRQRAALRRVARGGASARPAPDDQVARSEDPARGGREERGAVA